MITVACVLKSGGSYTSEWVRKLRDGVARHLTIPHRFVCLSDVEVPCERIPLVEGWRGWWSKIELFRPGLFDGPVVYLDLDSIVVGSLDRIAAHPHRFTMAHDFYSGHACSTAMAWEGDFSFIHAAFKADPVNIAHRYDRLLKTERRIGDQAFIEDQLLGAGEEIMLFDQAAGKKSIASYKVDHCESAPCPGASVVAFHGRPKPDALKSGWVAHTWR